MKAKYTIVANYSSDFHAQDELGDISELLFKEFGWTQTNMTKDKTWVILHPPSLSSCLSALSSLDFQVTEIPASDFNMKPYGRSVITAKFANQKIARAILSLLRSDGFITAAAVEIVCLKAGAP
jgi:hypothetical protein